jgi:polysaccharide export outer membrane protein
VAAAPAPAAIPVAPAANSIDGNAYTLKVGDGVQVYLRGIPMADAIEDQIDENGKISLPLINEIQAAGMTASALEQNIRKTYLEQDIYRNITVNVVVPTRFYFIQGEIRAPGRFQIISATRVSQAIAGAGGYTEYASGQVVVKRGGKIFKTIRNSRRLERTPDDDILLEPDDIIEVKRSLW